MAGLLFPMGTRAANDHADKLAQVQIGVTELSAIASSLVDNAAPSRGFITEVEAVQKFEEYLYRYMLGDYQRAAEGLYGLTTTGALVDKGLAADAQWYLAESLREIGNYDSAETQYRLMANADDHPFRVEAVRRLLEVLAKTGTPETFYDYYETQVVNGRVAPTPIITYEVGRAFYLLGDVSRSKSNFSDLMVGDDYYHKGRYFLGAIMVEEGNLEDALSFFTQNIGMVVTSEEDRKVVDLSYLAIARIHYENGDFQAAATAYGKISGDSEFLADKLYEIVWVFVKQDEFSQALRAVDIFLLAFPEHEYSPSLHNVRGHLQMKVDDYINASESYQAVIDDFTPVRDSISAFSSKPELVETLRNVFVETPEDSFGLLVDGVPHYALQMLKNNDSVNRSIALYEEIEALEERVYASQKLLDELKIAVSDNSTIGGFELVRHRSLFNYGMATLAQLDLMAVERDWIADVTDSLNNPDFIALDVQRKQLIESVTNVSAHEQERMVDYGDRLEELKQERLTLLQEVRELREQVAVTKSNLDSDSLTVETKQQTQEDLEALGADLAAVEARLERLNSDSEVVESSLGAELADMIALANTVDQLATRYHSFRPTGVNYFEMTANIDATNRSIGEIHTSLNGLLIGLDPREGEELDRIRGRLSYEQTQVEGQAIQRTDLGFESSDLSLTLAQSGLQDLWITFEDNVVRADLGLMDVYWAQKIATQIEKDALVDKKNRILNDLDQRFGLIREKGRQ